MKPYNTMKKINNYLNLLGLGWIFKASVLISIGLLIAGFIVPPTGVIDGSVLVAVGEIGIIINIPVFFAHASTNKLEASLDLDDKQISVSSTPKTKTK